MKPKKARELAGRILKHPRGGIKALLDLVDRGETEWLELKAASYPIDGVFDEESNEDDYHWDVAKAVIAMANSAGGVVLLGIDDACNPVGLEASDPTGKRARQGAEAFRRESILERVLLPRSGWRTKKRGKFKILNPSLLERLITLQELTYGQRSVLAILIDTVPRGFGRIVVEKTTQNSSDRVVYVRMRGAVGRNVELATDDPAVVKTHQDPHTLTEQENLLIWDTFLATIQRASPEQEVNYLIRSHVGNLANELSWLKSKFVQLKVVRCANIDTETATLRNDDVPGITDDWKPKTKSLQDELGGIAKLKIQERDKIQCLVTDLITAEARALIIGEAGSGKSTSLKALALRAAEEWETGKPWPIFIPLADFSTDGLPELLEKRCGMQWQDLANQLATGDAVLLLDGLNECSDSLYGQCQSEISSLLREYPKAKIIVSTRSSNAPEFPELATFEIRPLERPQQIQLLEKTFGAEEAASIALEKLCRQPGGAAIATSPVLLTIISEIAKDHRDIPASRAALYRLYVKTWHNRESQNRNSDFPWEIESIISALSTLAFTLRKLGLPACQTAFARQLLLPFLGKEVDHFIARATQGTLLNRDKSSGAIKFWHETIQEYLCAEYLVARQSDLSPDTLCGTTETKIATWAMPIAFALELEKSPSNSLLAAAWQAEPIITAAAVIDTESVRNLPINGDSWTRGVLKILRGEDTSEEEREITTAARLPPKYPLATHLVAALEGNTLWYAAQTHAAGLERMSQLRKTLCSGRSPWIELLPPVLKANPAWATELKPALRALTGTRPVPSLLDVLSTATIGELCALRRSGKISSGTFLSNWERVLDQSGGTELDLDLIDILRSEKYGTNELLAKMLPKYRWQIRKISMEKNLSLRVLNILVKERAIPAYEIRRDQERMQGILERMSMMNAIRLARSGVIRRSDLDETAIERIVYSSTPKQITEAIANGIINTDDIPTDFQNHYSATEFPIKRNDGPRKTAYLYSTRQLSDFNAKREIDQDLRSTRFTVKVKSVRPDNNFGFATHPEFENDIFFVFSAISTPNGEEIAIGQTLDVQIRSRFDSKKNNWGFAVESGRVTLTTR